MIHGDATTAALAAVLDEREASMDGKRGGDRASTRGRAARPGRRRERSAETPALPHRDEARSSRAMPGRRGPQNALLGALPPAERASLEPYLDPSGSGPGRSCSRPASRPSGCGSRARGSSRAPST